MGSGPPREWTPRPPGGAPGATPAAGGDARRREFGPDAPRRGKAKVRREEKPAGPIPIRSGGRIYDVDDVEETAAEEIEFDDFSKSQPNDEEAD